MLEKREIKLIKQDKKREREGGPERRDVLRDSRDTTRTNYT